MNYPGRWHKGKHPGGPYFGLHYDLHAGPQDTALGTHCTPRELIPSLKLMDPEWVQTDCKGVPGLTSWFSQVPEATVSPGVKKDALRGWRAATRQMGLPLHCHYCGVWDQAAAEKHPEWAVVPPPGTKPGSAAYEAAQGKICPRSGYLQGLMIPQLLEVVDRYGADGFWVDADICFVQLCYCERCRAAFREATGLKRAPTKVSDPHWVAWTNFHRQSFYDYVTEYVTALHEQRWEVLVCSNWLHTFRDPGEPVVPTDWISGDIPIEIEAIQTRCEARFMSTRGRPWDLMPWNFFKAGEYEDERLPRTTKPVAMLEQEAATILAYGGGLQVYENASGVRDGRLVDWRMKRLGQLGRWAKARRSFCRNSEMVPQVAVLHSEHHFYAQPSPDLYGSRDTAPVEGATYALLENQLSVDILDEWALLPRLADFPLVVIPEQHGMSEEIAQALVGYVQAGGKALFTGAETWERFGAAFWGARLVEQEGAGEHFIPAGDGAFAAWSKQWKLIKPRAGQALGVMGRTHLTDAELLPYASAVRNAAGTVVYVPWNLFRFFRETRYSLVRQWVGELVAALRPELGLKVQAPPEVDIIRRRKGRQEFIHLVNRASGVPAEAPARGVDTIPPVGPVVVDLRCETPPSRVWLAGEKADLDWAWSAGTLHATVPQVEIHAAVGIRHAL
jgi:hypothetical protein